MHCINSPDLDRRKFRTIVQAIFSRYFSEAFIFVYSAQWNTQGMHHMTVTIFKLENAQMGA